MTTAGMSISKSDIQSLSNKYKATAHKLARYKQEANQVARQVVHGLEASGTSFLLGVANGYWGEGKGVEVMGVPLDLIVAGGTVGLSFALDDDLAPHLQSVGLGATCAYATVTGLTVGNELRLKKAAGGGADGNLANQVPAPNP